MRLTNSPLCRRCEAEEDTSAHILYECKALASLRHAYLGSFFLDPEDVKGLSLGAIRNFRKVTGLPWLGIRLCGTMGLSKGLGAMRPKGLRTNHYLHLHLPMLPEAPLILLVSCFFCESLYLRFIQITSVSCTTTSNFKHCSQEHAHVATLLQQKLSFIITLPILETHTLQYL